MKRVAAIYNNLEEYIATILLLTTSVIVFMQVVLRYGFSFTLMWVEEAARYIIVWFIYLGSSIAVREKKHVQVDLVTAFLKPTAKTIFEIISVIVCIVFCAIVLRSGWNVVLSARRIGSMASSFRIPLYVPYAAVPFGLGLMLVRYLFQLKDAVLRLSNKETSGGKA